VRLGNAEERLPQASAAADGYRANFRAQEQLYRAGFGSLIDAEASRRQSLSSERAMAELRQERAAAWIALYRAAGGSWEESGEAERIGDAGAVSPSAPKTSKPADKKS
jgi:outer membrane protein TolC